MDKGFIRMVRKTRTLMRNLFFIFLFIGFGLNAQGPIANTAHLVSANIYSDDFEAYSTGDINGQGEWEVIDGGISVAEESSNNVFKGSTSGFNAAYYNETFDADQYSEIVAIEVTSYSSPGPIVRASTGGTYYCWLHELSTYSRLVRVVNGSVTTLAESTTGWTDQDTLRLEVDADTLFCYKNGVLDISISSDGKYTDDGASKISTGRSGILMFYQDNNAYGDLWRGGDL